MKVNNRRLQPGQLQQPRTTTTLHSSKTTVVKSVWRHAPTSHSSRASAAPSTTCVSARPALSRWRRWSVRCRYAAHGSTWFSVYISDSYRPTSLQAKITEEIYDIFTARRVCLARTMLWQDVCLSVCHTPVFCLNGYTNPQILYTVAYSSFFPHQTGWQYSDGDPLTRASNARGVWKNHDCRPISRFISQMMQDTAIVTI